jgi:hypothetical protein
MKRLTTFRDWRRLHPADKKRCQIIVSDKKRCQNKKRCRIIISGEKDNLTPTFSPGSFCNGR